MAKVKAVKEILSLEDLKKNIFIALEVLNGYTESEAIRNWECEHGKCQCE